MSDDSLMPFGKYKGTKLGQVPASYLLWLYDKGVDNDGLRNYIIDNLDVLKKQVAEEEQERKQWHN